MKYVVDIHGDIEGDYEIIAPLSKVLNDIKGEIGARLCYVVSDYTDGYRTAIQGVLAIIDKYGKEQK